METKQQRVIYPIDNLYAMLDKAIKKEVINDRNLQRKINEELSSKGMSSRFLTQLINEQTMVSQLEEYQLMAITKVCEDYLNWDELKLNRFFSDNQIIGYENYMNIEEDLSIIEFDNVLKINDFKYITSISFKYLYQLFKNNLITYNTQTQRNVSYKRVGNVYMKNISVDPEAVKNIKKLALEGKLNTSEITLNSQLMPKKSAKFKFEGDKFGTIKIVPDYDKTSDNYNFVSILDGYNRSMGITQAVAEYYNETGKWLQGDIEVKIVRYDIQDARNLVMQSFLRANVGNSDEFIESLNETDYTKFISIVENNSKFLKDNISNTFEEMKILNKLTTKKILTDIIKKTELKVESMSVRAIDGKRVAENFDLIIDIENENKLYINHTTTALYFYIACISDNEQEIFDYLNSINREELYKTNKKNVNIDELIKMLEVNRNE